MYIVKLGYIGETLRLCSGQYRGNLPSHKAMEGLRRDYTPSQVPYGTWMI